MWVGFVVRVSKGDEDGMLKVFFGEMKVREMMRANGEKGGVYGHVFVFSFNERDERILLLPGVIYFFLY